MTSQNGRRRLVGALAGGVVAGGLFAGIGAATAIRRTRGRPDRYRRPRRPTMTGEQALAIIQQDYDLGAGGGQLSNYVHEVLVLRNLGLQAVEGEPERHRAALEKRPNQAPLVEALKATVAYQRRIQAQARRNTPAEVGINQCFSIGGAPAPFGSAAATIMPADIPVDPDAVLDDKLLEHPGLSRRTAVRCF